MTFEATIQGGELQRWSVVETSVARAEVEARAALHHLFFGVPGRIPQEWLRLVDVTPV